MTIWFTADHHFGHKNIIRFCNRSFENLDEMDKALIHNWNQLVAPEDDVYHLGDVGLCSTGKLRNYLEQLNGRIYLIRGNHEKTAMACKNRFEWIRDRYELKVDDPDSHQGKRLIVLSHYAMRVWNTSHWGSWHLYGHSHGNLPDLEDSLSIDVGVDCHQYAPISYSQIKEIMSHKTWTPPFA